ncbi:hypothetical protein H6B10_17315, partial [Gemmiger formicilis]|nr:hypothetical protein [Gemmiger formicilis]
VQPPLELSYYHNNQILEYGPTVPGDPVFFVVLSGWSRRAESSACWGKRLRRPG